MLFVNVKCKYLPDLQKIVKQLEIQSKETMGLAASANVF